MSSSHWENNCAARCDSTSISDSLVPVLEFTGEDAKHLTLNGEKLMQNKSSWKTKLSVLELTENKWKQTVVKKLSSTLKLRFVKVQT